MTEKEQILEALAAGRAALGEALAGVDEEMAARKPAGCGWTIVECVEHMAVSERYLLSRLRAATKQDQPPVSPEREAKIAARAANRERKIEAPDVALPAGQFGSLSEALGALDATRAEVVRWVEECGDDWRCMATDHPLFAGPVNCYETLVMIAAHPGRHAQQIAEIREGFGTELEG
jgi:hypothetical protein